MAGIKGLTRRKRDSIWVLDKQVRGAGRIRASSGTRDRQEAERWAIETIAAWQAEHKPGFRRPVTFREAATRYLEEYSDRLRPGTADRNARALAAAIPFVGTTCLEQVHHGSLAAFVDARLTSGCSHGTVNRDLAVVRRVLTLSARKWRHANGMPWLDTVPLLDMPPPKNPRQAHVLTWEEQHRLMPLLPPHLARMALWALQTGCRQAEICRLRWEWIQELQGVLCVVIPAEVAKNGRERAVPLNRTCTSMLSALRDGCGSEEQPDGHVFNCWRTIAHRREFGPVQRVNNHGWRTARVRALVSTLRVHDLRHTVGSRLRFSGVGVEDRADILGHHSGRITTQYSKADLSRLLEAVERLTIETESRPVRLRAI